MDIILALDIGSSSVRCSAYKRISNEMSTVSGGVQALPGCSSSISWRSVEPNSGKIRLQGDGEDSNNLLDVVDQCIDTTLNVLRKQNDPFKIVAVGFSCFVMNMVGVDVDGNPVGSEATISYACNTVAVGKQCSLLRTQSLNQQQQDLLYSKTGAPIHSAYAVPQLREFYDLHSESRSSVSRWQTIPSICLGRWTGQAQNVPISYSEASWTGLLNVHTCQYETDATNLLPPPCQDALPALADFDEFPFQIQAASYYERWPDLRDSRLFLGLGDGACANIGSKCSTASRIAVTIGTSAASRICLFHPKNSLQQLPVPKGLFAYRVNRDHVLIGGALTDGGSVVEWARSFLNLNASEAMDACMDQVEKLANDATPQLTMIPFLSGERSTGYRTRATGAVVGLTRQTTSADFLKSCLDGVTLRIRAIVQLILEARQLLDDVSVPCVLVSGQALEKNEYWRQSLADALDLQVILDEDTNEGTSRGVARLVELSLTNEMDSDRSSLVEEEIGTSKVYTPNPKAVDFFKKAEASQSAALDALTPLYSI